MSECIKSARVTSESGAADVRADGIETRADALGQLTLLHCAVKDLDRERLALRDCVPREAKAGARNDVIVVLLGVIYANKGESQASELGCWGCTVANSINIVSRQQKKTPWTWTGSPK